MNFRTNRSPVWRSILNLSKIVLLSAVIFSCSQEDELTVILDQSGELTITIIDENEVALPNVEVALYSQYSSNILDEGVTNESGMVDFGTLQSGNYLVEFKTTSNGSYFEVSQLVQVVSANSNQKEIFLANYIETIFISVRNSSTGEIWEMEGLEIAIVPDNDEANLAANVEELLALATVNNGATDSNGSFTTDLPIGDYVGYLLSGNEIVTSEVFTVQHRETTYVDFYTTPISFVLNSGNTWTVKSVVSASTLEEIEHDYSTFEFTIDPDYALMVRDNNIDMISDDVRLYTYYGDGEIAELVIYFDSPYYYMGGYITLQDNGELSWECYDYDLGSVIITLS